MKILMCKPKHYGVFYEINPWMRRDIPVNKPTAEQQWQTLYETLLDLDVTVKLVEPIEGLPDMVFTANAGFIHQQEVWVSSFKTQERQLESKHFSEWFKKEEFMPINSEYDFTDPFEGAGDALFFNNHLIAGHGFRSEANIYQLPFFQQFNPVLCELVNPHFYHLDTCFCPLNDSLAMWYPDAFSEESQQKMLKLGEFITVPEAEAKRFACNAVVVGKHVILPSGCPETYRQLEEHGFQVHACDMSEYLKSGGACKCLTLAL